MKMVGKLKSITTLFMVLSAGELFACGICVIAAADAKLPPIYIWCFFVFAWYLVYSFIRTISQVSIRWIPRFWAAIMLCVLAFVVGSSFLGPLPLVPMLLACAWTFFVSFDQSIKEKWGAVCTQTIRIIGFVAVGAVFILGAWSIQIQKNRTTVDYIIQWYSSAPAHGAMRQLKSREPASLKEYREIVDRGRGFIIIDAAERIAVLGDPAVDVPRLENAMKRAQQRGDTPFDFDYMEKQIATLKKK